MVITEKEQKMRKLEVVNTVLLFLFLSCSYIRTLRRVEHC
jgi:hypothetical protein